MEIEDFYSKIDIICKQFCKTNNNPRIEFDDLRQEACVKFLELVKSNKSEDFIFTSIKNHLMDYIKKESRSKEMCTGLNFEYLYPNPPK